MTSAAQAAAAIQRSGLVAIVRTDDAVAARGLAEGLVDEGVDVLEVSLTVPGAEQTISAVRSRADGRALLGAGTVLGVADAERALQAGAQFLVSPNLDLELVEWAHERDVLHLPGVFTPTEVAAALRAGVTLLKLFPAGSVGPGYVRELLGPYPDAKLVPTGGVDERTAADHLAAGAVAVGVASALTSGGRAQLPDRVRRLLAVIRQPPTQENT